MKFVFVDATASCWILRQNKVHVPSPKIASAASHRSISPCRFDLQRPWLFNPLTVNPSPLPHPTSIFLFIVNGSWTAYDTEPLQNLNTRFHQFQSNVHEIWLSGNWRRWCWRKGDCGVSRKPQWISCQLGLIPCISTFGTSRLGHVFHWPFVVAS